MILFYNILQSAPANETQLLTNPMGALWSQSVLSCWPEEEQSTLVSQIGFRLVSIPKLVEREVSRNQSHNESILNINSL